METKMRETFAEFSAKLKVERKNDERIKTQSSPEWERVRGAVAGLHGIEGLDGHSFQWMDNTAYLTLEDVCVHVPGGRQQTSYTVSFSQQPALPGHAYVEESPIAAETWNFTPLIDNDKFVWEIKDESGKRMALPGLKADEVADEVAKGLVQYFIKYEAAYGR
jgi:hypothetical protein